MNEASKLLAHMFRWPLAGPERDIFPDMADRQQADFFHPQVIHNLFGPSGSKELLIGRNPFFAFVTRCSKALAERRDTILRIVDIDRQCAFVHARAYRRSRINGEQIDYEWGMLYRVEDGQITYGDDMLDARAQAFWSRILTP